jgi:3-oxoadipate enol-lactonase
MPFADRPDARIWWDQDGTGDPVLLIMGHAYGADMWHRTAPGLAASYRVIRFDNRGVGRSSDPPGPYPVPLMAGDALAVLDAAGAASAHVYGVSLGGAIALQLALGHPGRVRSLILGCTAASAGGASSRGALLTRVRSLLPAAALNRMAWPLLYGPDTPAGLRAEDQRIVRHTRCSGRGRRGQLTGAASFDVTARLAEIRVPALVMHGARDRIVPAASGRRLADGIAGARLVMFPEAGHAYITDVARAANQEVLRFLAGVSGPAGVSGQAGGSGTGTRPASGVAERSG